MDIQKENNLIQEAFEIEADEVGFCLDQKWGDYENPYENSDTALAFNLFKKGWQAKAQAVPEGFVLVPKTPDVNIVNKICTEFIIGEDLNGNPVGLEPCDAEDVLEIIVKALEPAND